MRAFHLTAMALTALAACAASNPTRSTAGASTPASAPSAPASAKSELPAPSSSSAAASPSGSNLDASATSSSAPASSPDAAASSTASEPVSAAASSSTSACNDQPPQDFLVRGNFLKEHGGNERAIQYRTDTYGYFPGFGHAAHDARPPSAYVVGTTFMSLPVRMHRKVVPALKCVEEEIKRTCGDHPYTAHALAGIRFRNTYRGGEVTNHIYGIAIDVDPSINTCCGCVPPWNDAPRCKRPAKTEYDRMEMPECWVHAFERFGFYWLGHDVLRDTMHFEFLGDPDRILKDTGIASGAAPPTSAAATPATRDGGAPETARP